MRPALVLAAAALALAALLASCAARPPDDPGARARALAPAWDLTLPDGPGPHPAALLLSGCDGVHDNMAFWADQFAAAGRAALVVDSHGPRGLDGPRAGAAVCTAATLRGPERAGDVAVALAALAATPGVDATDVVILGASHGGWTVMEFMALTAGDAPPPGLAAWPEPPATARARVTALVLLYPYCGRLNEADAAAWAGAPPTLMVLGERDHVTSAPACLRRAAALRAGGATVDTVVLAGADHAYDQQDRFLLSPLRFDEALREEARAAVASWLP